MIPDLSKLRLYDGLHTDAKRKTEEEEKTERKKANMARILDKLVALKEKKEKKANIAFILDKLVASKDILTTASMEIKELNLSQKGLPTIQKFVDDRIWSLENLTRLYLTRNWFGALVMKTFSDALSKRALPKLTHLYIRANGFGDEGMGSFADALNKRKLPYLITLDLRENGFSTIGMAAFSDALSNGALKNLKNLYLSNNNFGEGMSHFTKALKTNPLSELETLLIRNNGISQNGISIFVNGIKEKKALPKMTGIDLSKNNIKMLTGPVPDLFSHYGNKLRTVPLEMQLDHYV